MQGLLEAVDEKVYHFFIGELYHSFTSLQNAETGGGLTKQGVLQAVQNACQNCGLDYYEQIGKWFRNELVQV